MKNFDNKETLNIYAKRPYKLPEGFGRIHVNRSHGSNPIAEIRRSNAIKYEVRNMHAIDSHEESKRKLKKGAKVALIGVISTAVLLGTVGCGYAMINLDENEAKNYPILHEIVDEFNASHSYDTVDLSDLYISKTKVSNITDLYEDENGELYSYSGDPRFTSDFKREYLHDYKNVSSDYNDCDFYTFRILAKNEEGKLEYYPVAGYVKTDNGIVNVKYSYTSERGVYHPSYEEYHEFKSNTDGSELQKEIKGHSLKFLLREEIL